MLHTFLTDTDLNRQKQAEIDRNRLKHTETDKKRQKQTETDRNGMIGQRREID